MRTLLAALLLGVLALGASAEPSTQTVMSTAPQFAIQVPCAGVKGEKCSPRAPTNLVVVACRMDDLTGQIGRHGVDEAGVYHPDLAGRDWRDLEPHIVGGELECKREVSQLQDRAVVMDTTGKLAKPLNSNFGDLGQCVHAGAYWSTQWDQAHPGWGVVAIGCPVPIVDDSGAIKAWKMPECPTKIGGLEGIKCKFDESVI